MFAKRAAFQPWVIRYNGSETKDFDEWIAIVKDRSKWRQLTHSIPKPPDAWRLKDTSRENDYNCITQKDTQPSQACSEGYIFETGPEGPDLEVLQ